MAKKLFIGNLSYTTTDESLQREFSKFGEVISATVIKDKATGRSKGFGFVEMSEDSAADSAISSLNGNDVDGRKINVSEARPKEDRPSYRR